MPKQKITTANHAIQIIEGTAWFMTDYNQSKTQPPSLADFAAAVQAFRIALKHYYQILILRALFFTSTAMAIVYVAVTVRHVWEDTHSIAALCWPALMLFLSVAGSGVAQWISIPVKMELDVAKKTVEVLHARRLDYGLTQNGLISGNYKKYFKTKDSLN